MISSSSSSPSPIPSSSSSSFKNQEPMERPVFPSSWLWDGGKGWEWGDHGSRLFFPFSLRPEAYGCFLCRRIVENLLH